MAILYEKLQLIGWQIRKWIHEFCQRIAMINYKIGYVSSPNL